jgi:hypothetical protein
MENIIYDYTVGNLPIETICSKYKIGKLKVKKILNNNNIPINKRGIKPKNNVVFSVNIKNKILKCKKCELEFNDIENKSGSITKHIATCLPNIVIPNKLARANYKKHQGTYWHFQFFNIVDKVNFDTLRCCECDWTTPDITNRTGSLTKHIENSHGEINEYIKRNPSQKHLFNKINILNERNKSLETDHVICQICGEKLKYINNTHLMKHNITLTEYKIKFLNKKILSVGTVDKLKISYDNVLKLHQNTFKSKVENEIFELIKSYGFDVINNNKKILNGTEMDIYIPELKLCFEYNGLYYHSEKMGKDKWFHLKKQNLANEKGIKLIHIFEDEWYYKKEIVKKKIIHLIGKNTNEKIYARKCEIKIINTSLAYDFLEKNHIQGAPLMSTFNIGAYYNNILIGVMTFSSSNELWTLSRFATDINYRCIGISSKLFKNFLILKNNPIVISFADRRWTTDLYDNLYIKLGFKIKKINPPDYKYINGKIQRNNRLHKFLFRKKILLKKYPEILDNTMTENEMVTKIGCTKIWDCGLIKYQYN